MLYVACRETGDFIEMVDSVNAGKNLINEYEKQDKENGVYTENFYDIVDENHCSINNMMFADYDNNRYFKIISNNNSGLNECEEYHIEDDEMVFTDMVRMTDRELSKLYTIEV